MRVERLRIAFATPEYVTETYVEGGRANYTHRGAKALAGLGHDVHVLTLSDIDDAEFEHAGVAVHRITISKWLRGAVSLLNFSVNVYQTLKRLHAEQPFHLMQFPNYSCCGLVAICCLEVPHVLRASSYQPAWNDAPGSMYLAGELWAGFATVDPTVDWLGAGE